MIPAKWGQDFLVNTTTAGLQALPSASSLSDGRFVVAWTDYGSTPGDTSPSAIRAQVFNADGTKYKLEFLVNTTTAGFQSSPVVAGLTNGSFVVAFEDQSGTSGDTSPGAIKAQIFKADGTRSGGEFLINTTTAGNQNIPAISALADGRFVAVWADASRAGDDTSGEAIKAQIFRANGSKFGDEFLVNTTTAGGQFNPQVTTLTDGGFVVTWDDPSNAGADSSPNGIRAQKFTASGVKSGGEIQVNTTTANNQALSVVTALSDGRFAVAWADDSRTGDDTSGYAIRAQVFNANGSKSGGEVLVNTTTFEWQHDPAIATLADGRFVIAWTDYSTSGQDTSGLAVRAQVFNGDGSKSGKEFLVNTITAGWQLEQTITALPDGRFVLAWTDGSTTGGDSSPSGIRGQILDPRLSAVDLAGTSGADNYFGTRFADKLKGAQGADVLDGSNGNDLISGDDGADTLTGGGGKDVLDGGTDNDTLVGGTGKDILTGGEGNDYFYFVKGFGADRIQDFSRNNNEKIDLSEITAIVDFADLVANHLKADSATGFAMIFAGKDSILLNGITVSQFGTGLDYSAEDFVF